MIAPTPFFADRGCHVRIYEEARVLQDRGHQVTIVTYHIGRDLPGFDIRRIPSVVFWYKKLEAGPSWWKFVLDAQLLMWSLWTSYRHHFDIVHAHLHEGVLIGWFSSRLHLRRIPLVFDYQGSLTGELLGHHFIREHMWLYGAFRVLERMADRAADVILCSSSPSAVELTGEFGIAPDRVLIIPDGVNTSEFRPGYDLTDLRKELGLDDDRRVVVYLGVLTEYQGVDLLLDAIPSVLSSVDRVHFLVMGYPNEALYREKAESLGLTEAVTFTGRIPYEDAPRYLGLADLAVAPKIATTEANGKLYDYMACGLPSVVFESEVNREILGDLGVYARHGDSEDLAAKLVAILEDASWRDQLARDLRRKAVTEHSWDATARRIEGVYRDLLD